MMHKLMYNKEKTCWLDSFQSYDIFLFFQIVLFLLKVPLLASIINGPFQRIQYRSIKIFQMKLFALSSLVGLGLLAQQSQSTLGFDQYINDVFSIKPTPNLGVNQGLQNLQNLFNGFNLLNNHQDRSNRPGPSSNLKSQPQQPINYSVPRIDYPSDQPKNPLEFLNPKTWNIFDNNKSFCASPRVWDGTRCKCPNNACFLSGKCYTQPPKQIKKDELLALRLINRNFDGTENNPQNPLWGSKSSDLSRLCPADYQDGKSVMWSHKPNPRDVSNLVGELEGQVKQSKLGINMLFNIWGQFLDHDLTLTPAGTATPMNIQIPRCDKFMDKLCTGKKEFPVFRSIFNSKSQVREHINVLTAWNDASQVYGSDKETADSLRQFKNGKLKTSQGNFLPKDEQGGFIAGEARVNQNVALTIFHTIFVRQHNRVCDVVLKKNAYLSDEEIFQIARNYVIGLVQHITFDEYLPILLGKSQFESLIGPYKYDNKVNPNIFTQFSAAGFRLGHPLINSPFKLMDNFGNTIRTLQLGQMFFNPKLLTKQSFTQFTNGLARNGIKQRQLQLVHDLRNFLFLVPNREVKIDLFSFNLQRGRDHGICSVKNARQKLGLKDKQFKEIFDDKQKAKCLQRVYHSTGNLDLWLAIVGQKSEPGSVLGQLGIKLNAFQFKNIRNGDKYWYQNTYPDSIIKQIQNTSFADVIKRNSGVKYLNNQTFKKL